MTLVVKSSYIKSEKKNSFFVTSKQPGILEHKTSFFQYRFNEKQISREIFYRLPRKPEQKTSLPRKTVVQLKKNNNTIFWQLLQGIFALLNILTCLVKLFHQTDIYRQTKT